MGIFMNTDLLFYSYWIVLNGLSYYAQIDVLLRFTQRSGKKYMVPYIMVNCVLTALAIGLQVSGWISLLQVPLLFLYAHYMMKIRMSDAIAPIIIIFTLATFMEGFQTIFMRFLSLNIEGQEWGNITQFTLPFILVICYILGLRLAAKRYSRTNQAVISSYLYVLLLPCALMVWGIRMSLGLDQTKHITGYLTAGVNGEAAAVVLASFWMAAAVLTFFVITEIFYKITELSRLEIEKTRLAEQVKTQHGYVAEARQRNQEYRSFHHDIRNHLLVVSGLLNTKEYEQAAAYLQKLQRTASEVSTDLSTGNAVLDVLLWEKIRYAKQFDIAVTCDITIPEKNKIDDIDLCVLFANGMDNAIKACMTIAPELKTIVVNARQKHEFLLIDITNHMTPTEAPVIHGTGLNNIMLTAAKYHGTMFTEHERDIFTLSILLCNPSA